MRYAIRVTPWLMLVASCGVIVGLMALVAAWPSIMWPLEGAAIGVIAGTVAMALDERCAAIVDTLPRGLVWRSTARAALVVPMLLAVWLGCLFAWQHRLPAHSGLFALQGVAAAGTALAFAVWSRATGSAEPGAPFAAAVIPVTMGLALLRPWTRWLPLFPVWPNENWALSRTIWSSLAIGVPITAFSAAVAFHVRARHRSTVLP
jgi:hypothetical protein